MSDDADISNKYRELGAEEPPRALDDAILAAARREAGARQRWYAPLATAAVLVLAVAVTLNMQLERPGIESPAPQRMDPPAVAATSPGAKEELKLKATADLKVAPRPAAEADTRVKRNDAGQAVPAAPAAREPQPFAANQQPERAAPRVDARSDDTRDTRGPSSIVTGESARKMEERVSRDAEAGERAPQVGALGSLAKRSEGAAAGAVAQPQLQERQAPPPAAPAAAMKPMQTSALAPEQELERIADLRRQARHDEADKALAEFRKRYPDFRIPEATRERVERR